MTPAKGGLADESQGVFRTAAARGLGRDQDVDVGFLAVADVVDEGDFGPDVVHVPVLKVDEDLGRLGLDLGQVHGRDLFVVALLGGGVRRPE